MVLMLSPYPILMIIALYLWFCLKAGPHFMRNRKPFELKEVLIGYNLLLVLLNVYGVIVIVCKVLPNVNYLCEPVADISTSYGRTVISGAHLIMFAKTFELSDTVLFVLRKKYNQVSGLHVYHHAVVPIMGWVLNKYCPGGNYWLFALLNLSVHSVMYFYYLISALGPKYRKYLWWKKYITIMQLAQFVVLLGHGLQALFRDCNFPKAATLLYCVQSVIFLKLFGQFYINTYIKGNSRNNRKTEEGNQTK